MFVWFLCSFTRVFHPCPFWCSILSPSFRFEQSYNLFFIGRLPPKNLRSDKFCLDKLCLFRFWDEETSDLAKKEKNKGKRVKNLVRLLWRAEAQGRRHHKTQPFYTKDPYTTKPNPYRLKFLGNSRVTESPSACCAPLCG